MTRLPTALSLRREFLDARYFCNGPALRDALDARQNGVPAGFRNVPFLDDVENVAAIETQINLAMRGAREKGEAIAIGHPHPATLEALRAMLPKARSQGVRLVYVSELVH